MRRRDKILIGLIIAWQGIFGLVWLAFWVSNLMQPGISFFTHDFVYISWRSIMEISANIFGLVLIPTAISGFVGLMLKKEWGRRISLVSMVLIFLSTVMRFCSFISVYFFFSQFLVLIIAALILNIPTILTIVYLTRSRVRAVFQSQPETGFRYELLLVSLVLGIPFLVITYSAFYINLLYRPATEISDLFPSGKHYRDQQPDLLKNRELWASRTSGNYDFTLIITTDNSTIEGGLEKIEAGEGLIAWCRIGVRNNEVVSVTRLGGPELDTAVIEHANTVPKLFDLLERLNKSSITDDLASFTGIQNLKFDDAEPYLIDADCHWGMGYPTSILVYQEKWTGERDQFNYSKNYQFSPLVNYRVFDLLLVVNE